MKQNIHRITYTYFSELYTNYYYRCGCCCNHYYQRYFSIISHTGQSVKYCNILIVTSMSCGCWHMPMSFTMHGWSSCTITFASPRNSSLPLSKRLGFSILIATSTWARQRQTTDRGGDWKWEAHPGKLRKWEDNEVVAGSPQQDPAKPLVKSKGWNPTH